MLSLKAVSAIPAALPRFDYGDSISYLEKLECRGHVHSYRLVKFD